MNLQAVMNVKVYLTIIGVFRYQPTFVNNVKRQEKDQQNKEY